MSTILAEVESKELDLFEALKLLINRAEGLFNGIRAMAEQEDAEDLVGLADLGASDVVREMRGVWQAMLKENNQLWGEAHSSVPCSHKDLLGDKEK